MSEDNNFYHSVTDDSEHFENSTTFTHQSAEDSPSYLNQVIKSKQDLVFCLKALLFWVLFSIGVVGVIAFLLLLDDRVYEIINDEWLSGFTEKVFSLVSLGIVLVIFFRSWKLAKILHCKTMTFYLLILGLVIPFFYLLMAFYVNYKAKSFIQRENASLSSN